MVAGDCWNWLVRGQIWFEYYFHLKLFKKLVVEKGVWKILRFFLKYYANSLWLNEKKRYCTWTFFILPIREKSFLWSCNLHVLRRKFLLTMRTNRQQRPLRGCKLLRLLVWRSWKIELPIVRIDMLREPLNKMMDDNALRQKSWRAIEQKKKGHI